MKRILTLAVVAVGGTLAMSGVASADIGDVRQLSIDGDLFGSASEVEVTGTLRCQATIEYGLWVGVGQNPSGSSGDEFIQEESDTTNGGITDEEAEAEGVGAFGPNFDPPVGVSDDSPCSQNLQGYDVVVQQNRDSGDFIDGDFIDVLVIVGTSAENGGRGPGPFIGDILGLSREELDFERTR